MIPDPLGSLQRSCRSPDPLARLKGKGRDGKGRKRRGRQREERGEEGRGGNGTGEKEWEEGRANPLNIGLNLGLPIILPKKETRH